MEGLELSGLVWFAQRWGSGVSNRNGGRSGVSGRKAKGNVKQCAVHSLLPRGGGAVRYLSVQRAWMDWVGWLERDEHN